MSGKSTREKKIGALNTGIGAERPHQATDAGVMGMAITVTPTARQQLIACDPPGQHALCAESAERSVEIWQSGCIERSLAASTSGPCRQRAISTIQEMRG